MGIREKILELLKGKGKPWIPKRCPIGSCGAKLEPHGKGERCKNGHYFGPDAPREPLINSGEHRGEGEQGI